MTTNDLERLALDAHNSGEPWAVFWQRHEGDVRRLHPWNRQRFGRLYLRLFSLLTSGDLDGDRAVGDPEPWATDDEADQQGEPTPSDTHTSARFQGTFWDTSEPYA